MVKKEMTAWDPDVGASGRQSEDVIRHAFIIADGLLRFNGFLFIFLMITMI